jgi:hypothetical protein
MAQNAPLNWDFGKKTVVRLEQMQDGAEALLEATVSPDGENVAAAVQKDESTLGVVVNDVAWDGDFEKVLGLQFLPDGRLFAMVRVDDEWTVAIDGVLWDERFEFVWNPKWSADGKHVAVQIKQDNEYGVAINGSPWAHRFLSLRDFALSPDGQHAAASVQVAELAEADIFAFMEGTWSIAVDGVAWEQKFVNAYTPVFSADGNNIAAQVRTGTCEYTYTVDGNNWSNKFSSIWEPLYSKQGWCGSVRRQGMWQLVGQDRELWQNSYVQLWKHTSSPDAARIAAVVATGYGQWTVAVDDKPWATRWTHLVLEPCFSADSSRVAAIVKSGDAWGVAVDGVAWPNMFDMVWQPVLSRDGRHVAAHVEKQGKHFFIVNGKAVGGTYAQLWDPVFDAASERVLIRGVVDGSIVREVVSLT